MYDGYTATLMAVAAGQPLKSFFTAQVRWALTLVASPQKSGRLRRVEALRGAVVGITSFGSPPEVVLPGAGPNVVAALAHGRVDAAFATTRTLALLRRRAPGGRVLLDLTSAEGSKSAYGSETVAAAGLTARADGLLKRHEAARRAARAMARTLAWLRDHSPDEIYARMQPQYRSDDKDGDMQALRVFVSGISPDGRMPVGGAEAVQRVVSASHEAVLKIELPTTYTNQFLEGK